MSRWVCVVFTSRGPVYEVIKVPTTHGSCRYIRCRRLRTAAHPPHTRRTPALYVPTVPPILYTLCSCSIILVCSTYKCWIKVKWYITPKWRSHIYTEVWKWSSMEYCSYLSAISAQYMFDALNLNVLQWRANCIVNDIMVRQRLDHTSTVTYNPKNSLICSFSIFKWLS